MGSEELTPPHETPIPDGHALAFRTPALSRRRREQLTAGLEPLESGEHPDGIFEAPGLCYAHGAPDEGYELRV
jgi:hypothetical protein